MRKLRKAELAAIDKMRRGYVLRTQNLFGFSAWLRRELPKGYILSSDIRRATLNNLITLGLIAAGKIDRHKHQRYNLTKLGRTINIF